MEELTEWYLSRYRLGEAPSIEDLARQHPALRDEIQELLPTVVAMEQLKQRRECMAQTRGTLSGLSVREQLGDFLILREVGRGGMGIVYEAEQQSLGRRVAVKVLPRQMLLEQSRLRRFEREARTAAGLHHTNIVPIFGVGEQDGLHYYVMQFIRGRGLEKVLEELRQSTGQSLQEELGAATHGHAVARLGAQVADALQYAHGQGTLHRDIKPSNLILDEQGSVWITDFGLAKAVEQDQLSAAGDLVGTLRYMAPEQFQGIYDARSDVYCLGLTLYELLTLRPAFADESRSALLQRVQEGKIRRPCKLSTGIPKDLETIVLKATARDPLHRYASAGELALDLQRFLEDRPIHALPTPPLQHLWRWCRRNRAVASLSLVALLAVLGAAVVGWTAYGMTRGALLREARLGAEARTASSRAEANLALSLQAFEDIFDQVAGMDLLQPVPVTLGEVAEEGLVAQAAAGAAEEGAAVESGVESGVENAAPTEAAAPVRLPRVVSQEDAALLNRILVFYDRFALENAQNDRLQQDTAKAQHRVGDIHQSLGQLVQANAAYRRALQIYEQLDENRSGSAGLLVERATIHNELGRIELARGALPRAEEEHRKVLQLLGEKGGDRGSTVPGRYQLARAHNSLGALSGKYSLGFPTGSAQGPRRAAPAGPAGPGGRWGRGGRGARGARGGRGGRGGPGARGRRGGRVEGGGRRPGGGRELWAESWAQIWAESRGHHEEALGLIDGLLAEFPESPVFRLDQARTYRHLARWKEATTILEQLVAESPAVAVYRYELAETLAMPRFGATEPTEPTAASERLQRALAMGEELAEQYPTVPEYSAFPSRVLEKQGRRAAAAGKLELAESCHRRAVEFLAKAVARFPEAPSYRHSLARCKYGLGLLLYRRGKFKASKEQLEQAMAEMQRYLDSPPRRRNVQRELYGIQQSLRIVLLRLGETERAEELRRRPRSSSRRR